MNQEFLITMGVVLLGGLYIWGTGKFFDGDGDE